MRSIVNELLQEGHARVELAVSDLLPEVIGGFHRLLAEPPEYQDTWEPVQRDPETGEPLRDAAGAKIPLLPWDEDIDDLLFYRGYNDGALDKDDRPHDNKAIFHYRKWTKALLYMMGVDFKRHEAFLNDCDELHSRLYRHWLRVCMELDRQLPGLDMTAKAAETPFHVLRVMQYLEVRPGTTVIGKGHTDKSAMTYHVAEEHEACMLEGKLLKYIPDRPVLFGANGIEAVTKGKIPAMNHEVVVREGFPERRWVVIFFPQFNLNDDLRRVFPQTLAAK